MQPSSMEPLPSGSAPSGNFQPSAPPPPQSFQPGPIQQQYVSFPPFGSPYPFTPPLIPSQLPQSGFGRVYFPPQPPPGLGYGQPQFVSPFAPVQYAPQYAQGTSYAQPMTPQYVHPSYTQPSTQPPSTTLTSHQGRGPGQIRQPLPHTDPAATSSSTTDQPKLPSIDDDDFVFGQTPTQAQTTKYTPPIQSNRSTQQPTVQQTRTPTSTQGARHTASSSPAQNKQIQKDIDKLKWTQRKTSVLKVLSYIAAFAVGSIIVGAILGHPAGWAALGVAAIITCVALYARHRALKKANIETDTAATVKKTVGFCMFPIAILCLIAILKAGGSVGGGGGGGGGWTFIYLGNIQIGNVENVGYNDAVAHTTKTPGEQIDYRIKTLELQKENPTHEEYIKDVREKRILVPYLKNLLAACKEKEEEYYKAGNYEEAGKYRKEAVEYQKRYDKEKADLADKEKRLKEANIRI